MAFIGPIEDRLAIHELVMVYGDAVTRKNQMIGDLLGMRMQYGVFLTFPG